MRQIVKLSNGRLGVESEFGKGSMFWFELPYSLPPPKRDTNLLHPDGPTGPAGPGSGGQKSPTLSRAPTTSGALGSAGLDMIVETSSPGVHNDGVTGFDFATGARDAGPAVVEKERPVMVTTESTAPLLGSSTSSRRRSSDSEFYGMIPGLILSLMDYLLTSVAREGVITATFPPVEGSEPEESPDRDLFVQPAEGRDFFRTESVGRRSSDDSRLLAATPKKDRGSAASTAKSGKHAKEAKAAKEASEPPLCTLVVDDDK